MMEKRVKKLENENKKLLGTKQKNGKYVHIGICWSCVIQILDTYKLY